MTLEAWLFDLYPLGDRMVLWFLDAEGRAHRLTDGYRPAFYIDGDRREVAEVLRRLGPFGAGDAEKRGGRGGGGGAMPSR